jgi:hypothetical protein
MIAEIIFMAMLPVAHASRGGNVGRYGTGSQQKAETYGKYIRKSTSTTPIFGARYLRTSARAFVPSAPQ